MKPAKLNLYLQTQFQKTFNVCYCKSHDVGEEFDILSSCPPSSDKPMDLKQGDKESILKPFALVTAKPKQEHRQETTTYPPALNSTSDTTFLVSLKESYDSVITVITITAFIPCRPN